MKSVMNFTEFNKIGNQHSNWNSIDDENKIKIWQEFQSKYENLYKNQPHLKNRWEFARKEDKAKPSISPTLKKVDVKIEPIENKSFSKAITKAYNFFHKFFKKEQKVKNTDIQESYNRNETTGYLK